MNNRRPRHLPEDDAQHYGAQAARLYIGRWFNLNAPPASETGPRCAIYHATRGRSLHQRGIVHVAHITAVPIYAIRKAVARSLEARLRARVAAGLIS